MKTDLEIQKDIIEELKWNPILTASEIGVSVKNGIVALSGKVDSYFKKTAAENAAKKIAGVKAVAEEIVVSLPGSYQKTDIDIAEAILASFKWNSAIKEDQLKIKVEDGIVTLEGEVDWEFQKNAAQTTVENIIGVWGVVNNIRISQKVTPKDIKNKITSTFQRSATLDAENIIVEIIGNKVVLTGKVHSLTEKDDAEKAAWAAPGIDKVDNKLEIDMGVLVS